MKKLLTHVALVFLTVCLVIGCGRHHYPQSLLTADSLAEVRPDSSLKMLEAMAGEMATAPETDQMYYRLLRIKASDKCDRLQPDTFEITQIVDYYEQAGDSLLPAAYYYAGRTYYDLHDMPQALGYYQKAVDAICDRQTRPYLLLKEVCYSQMGYIFMYQKLYEQAKEMHIKEISTAQQINDTLGLSYGYRDLGFIYSELENYKDAINMLKMALFKAHSSNNDKLEFAIKSYLANTYRHLGDYDSALYYLRPVLENVNLLSKSSVYSNAAKIYYDKGKIDSALYYFHQLELVGGVYAKENAYKHLLQDAIIRKEFVYQDELVKYYNAFDALIFPTKRKSESLGLVGLEAMACHTPTIICTLYGPKSYANKSNSLVYTKTKDGKELANKIKEYMKLSSKDKETLINNAYNTSKEYDKDSIKDALQKIFDKGE